MSGAFDDNNGKQVPLIWNRAHEDPEAVIGHAILHSKDDGIFADCYLNDSDSGKAVRTLFEHLTLKFYSQAQAKDFKMMCLGVAAICHGRLSGFQLKQLINTVNDSKWAEIPGQWVQIADSDPCLETDTVGWTTKQLMELSMHDEPILEDGSRRAYYVTFEPPVSFTLDQDEQTTVVDHPNYYLTSRFEAIDIIDDFCDKLHGRIAFDNGNAIKYILRWHRKNGVEDLKKAIWYIQDIIKQIESEEQTHETSTNN